MRLHALTLTAFGPFSRTEQVDFDALHDAGLFLLSGPTGAGKTSILDAVVFALYGVVPGARQGAGRLRSDHAAPDVVTRVGLEFTCRGRRFRVDRTPAWDRPKKRGTGTVREQASVLLTEITCAGDVVLSSRLDEAGHLLRDVLGMSSEQFCQVVLLPQGEFARFLRADADARRAILQTLFATERFAAIEAWLGERRRQSFTELETREGDLRVLLARAAQAAGVPAPPDDQDPADWMGEVCAAALHEADQKARTVAPALAAREEAVSARAAAERLAESRSAALTLHQQQQALDLARPAHDAGERELRAARAAARVAPVLDAAGAARRALALSDRSLEQARRALPSSFRQATAAELRRTAGDLHSEIAVLRALCPDEATLEQHRADADAARRRLAALTRRIGETDARRMAIPLARVAAVAEQDTALAALGEEARLTPEESRLAGRVEAGLERDRMSTALEEARAGLTLLRESAVTAKEAWLDARSQRLDGMAGELAAALVDDLPCPVCGSGEHPRPAVASGDPAADEEAAHAHSERAEADRAQAAQIVGQLETMLATATAVAGAESTQVLRSELAQTRTLLVTASTEALGLVAARARLAALAEEERGLADAMEELAAGAATAAAEQASAELAAATLEQRLCAARGEDPSISVRVVRLTAESAALLAAAERDEEQARCSSQLSLSVTAAEQTARAAGFADAAAAASAVRDSARMTDLEAAIRSYDDTAAGLALRLSEPPYADGGLQALLATPEPDLPAMEAALRAAQRSCDDVVAEHRLTTRTAGVLEQLAVEVDADLAELVPCRERHHTIAGLAGLAEGTSRDNTLRMRLSAYVLAARLEQVAEAATERLLRMTSGRYSLAHTTTAASGRGRAGLGLTVLDAWTGVERDPATLSGGEAFSASLALALGLADIVAAEAGGAVLETLFVDEGFGSLDEETLDEVLDVLDGLREGGRVVGLVSHVAELRQRVTAQLQVQKGRDGSHVRLVGCARGRDASADQIGRAEVA